MTFNPSARPAFNKFYKKCKTFKLAAISKRPHGNWRVPIVNQRIGNVLVAFTSVLIAFHWRMLQISRRSSNVLLAMY